MSSGISEVVVVGSFNVDHVWRCEALPAPGATLAGEYASGAGGKGFNQAVAAARAGARTAFVCALGDDAGGRLARELAGPDGIALHAAASTLPTGTAGIFVDARGGNSIIIGAGANAALETTHIEACRDMIAAAGVVLAQLESPPQAVARALSIARDGGAIAILNPAPANANASGELLALADVLTPNETEFAALLGRHGGAVMDPATVAGMGEAELHALCRRLLPGGTVVVTLGAAGAFVSHPDSARRGDDRAYYRVPPERVRVVDTTGAGDAFNGALATGLARGGDVPFAAHVRFAGRYAALSTERPGAAEAMPAPGAVQARFGGAD